MGNFKSKLINKLKTTGQAMIESNPVISLKEVSKRFGNTQALNRVSLDIPRGIVFALLGENGAGKTTMIRILTGFQKPDSGTAQVLGNDCVKQGEEIRRAIGYVSDSPAPVSYTHLTLPTKA